MFQWLHLGAKCSPSDLELRFAEVMTKMPALWGKYPTDTTFGIDDKAVMENGYYVISDPEEAKKVKTFGLAEPCDGLANMYKIKTASKVVENYFPSCSSEENKDACLPPLKDFYEKMNKNVGQHRADSKRLAKVLASDNFKKIPSSIQMAVYDVAHEMFHSYQEESGKFDLVREEPEGNYGDCLKRPQWLKQYKEERTWWQGKISEIYDSKTNQDRLRSLALEFAEKIRPTTPVNKACNESLDHVELSEGTAHFVGNLAMLKSEVISNEELAAMDSQYFDAKTPSMHIYGTGGAISMLLERMVGPAWRNMVGQGIYPLEILRMFLANPEQCLTYQTGLNEKLQDLSDTVEKLKKD